MTEYMIKDVECFSQDNNKYIDPITKKNVASVSCFNTCVAMCVRYALKLKELDKSAVGCGISTDLDDYINMIIDDNETQNWINTNLKGSWIIDYIKRNAKRQVFAIESYVFNRLMNQHGFKCQERYDLTYETICNVLKQNELPMIIGGNFSSVSSVGGHMNCLVGYNSIGLKEFIVNDPHGNALTGYTNKIGAYVRYPIKFFLQKDNTIWCLVISKI